MADLGERAVQSKPPELQEELLSPESRDNTSKRDAPAADHPSDAKRSRPAAADADSTQQACVLYKPQTQMTRPHYGGLLGAIQHHLGAQPFDVLAGVAHGVLAALKNHQLDPGDKKKAIDRLFRGTIHNQLFHYLVFIAYYITDFHGASAAGNAAAAAPPAPAVQDELGEGDDNAAAAAHSTQPASVLYKPQTQMTRAPYEDLLGVIQHQPFDVLAGVAHGVLAALKNHQLDPGDKKKAMDRLFRGTIPNQLFDYLVFTAYFITDFHGAPPAPAVDATLRDIHVGVPVNYIVFFFFLLPCRHEMHCHLGANHRALFNVVMQHISRDNPLDVKAWVVDKLLATLKNDELDNTAKKEDIEEEWLHKRISSEFFDQLVSMGKLITDYHGAGSGLEGRDSYSLYYEAPENSDTLDLQKREMEWRKKQHEETISLRKKQHEENISLRKKQLEEKISLRKKDIDLREKQAEAKLITAEAGIMAIDIQKVPPYMKSYYIAAPMANLADAPAVQNKPPEVLLPSDSESRGNKTKRDDAAAAAAAADPSDAKRSRPAAAGSTQPASALYKPQSETTRRLYEGLRSAIQRHLRGQPFDIIAGVAHGVLAALKNHQLDPGDKKKAIDHLFRGTIPNELFDYLVYAAYYITDFHSGTAAGNAAATAPPAPAVDATTIPLHDNNVGVPVRPLHLFIICIAISVQDELGEDDDDDNDDDDEEEDGGMGALLTDLDIEMILSIPDLDILYKPQTNKTCAAYKSLLNTAKRHIRHGKTFDMVAWFGVGDKVLATLKNDKLNDTAKKKAIDELLHKTISSKLFDQLVSIGKLLTDYHGAAAGDAAGLEERDGCKTRWSRGAVDTSSSSEPVSQEETEMKHDERTAQIVSAMKREKIQIMRDMLDLQKREMEWRKKQHEENISLRKKQHEEEISLRKKDIELREKQAESKLITAEAGIMAIDIQTLPRYMRSYYVGMQRQIMERRGFSHPPSS
ncbi:hypothetical protein U9M48_025992 [Paspalum notatum var. saurae]|uniref:Pre-mRNA-splicing helicase BRR2-like plug domain-containing protein n=1 Tax=Paspalum notatum var. saurae TaxID=547442 RepID=A0AAQ3TTR5_PASNO